MPALVLLFLLLSSTCFAEGFTVCGTVSDAERKPLATVSVRVRSGRSFTAVLTDSLGRFCLSSLKENDTLFFSLTGYSKGHYVVKAGAEIGLALKKLNYSLYPSNTGWHLAVITPVDFHLLVDTPLNVLQAPSPKDNDGIFTLVEISPSLMHTGEELEMQLAKDIRSKKKNADPRKLVIAFTLERDSIYAARVISDYEGLGQQVLRNLSHTFWRGPVRNGRHLPLSIQLHFSASVKKHKLLLKLRPPE